MTGKKKYKNSRLDGRDVFLKGLISKDRKAAWRINSSILYGESSGRAILESNDFYQT
jgi:hypothetical protein